MSASNVIDFIYVQAENRLMYQKRMTSNSLWFTYEYYEASSARDVAGQRKATCEGQGGTGLLMIEPFANSSFFMPGVSKFRNVLRLPLLINFEPETRQYCRNYWGSLLASPGEIDTSSQVSMEGCFN